MASSAPGIDGMVDIRSFAILQDVTFDRNDCAHGVAVAAARGPFYRRYTHALPTAPLSVIPANTLNHVDPATGQLRLGIDMTSSSPRDLTNPCACPCQPDRRGTFSGQPIIGVVTGNRPIIGGFSPFLAQNVPDQGQGHQPEQHSAPFFSQDDDGLEPPKNLDTARSWLCCFCSVAVIFVIFGTIFSYGILQLQMQLVYGLSFMESVTVGASCFTIFILVGPLATFVIKCAGFRSTAIFGMLLIFIGLLAEGFITHVIVFYVSRLALIPVGGGFAHTASHYMTSFFETKIKIVVLILCACSTLGILVYSWFAATLQGIVSYKGIQVTFAIIVLMLMTATHAFPMRLHKTKNVQSNQNQQIRDCVHKNVKKNVMERAGKTVTEYNPDGTAELKSCLCVCVCEVGTICNRGFFLWAGITMVASLTFIVPYLFLFLFQLNLMTPLQVGNTPFRLVLAFCVPTLITRLCLICYNDHTFFFNRTAFQIALAGTGVVLILFVRVTTYGWLMVWMMGIGVCQGLVTVTIPKVTLQTVNRKWLKKAWIVIIVLDALGAFIGPIVLMMLRFTQFPTPFRLPTLIIGILQFIATVLTFLIPNDESNYKVEQPPAPPPPPNSQPPPFTPATTMMPPAPPPPMHQPPAPPPPVHQPPAPAQPMHQPPAPVRPMHQPPVPQMNPPRRESYREYSNPAKLPSRRPSKIPVSNRVSRENRSRSTLAPIPQNPDLGSMPSQGYQYDYKSNTYIQSSQPR